MSGDAADDLQVGYRGADVLGGDVAATEPLHRPSERLPKRLGLVVRRIADHHRLAAAERQLGECRLVGHAARQPQRIGDGVLLPGVAPHATRSEEHTSELQSLMRISYAVFCLQKKKHKNT